MTRVHVTEIDLVRLFAALSVFLFHVSWQNPALPNSLPWGWVGVEIFFVVSGLVIGQSAFHSSASGFLESRFFRLVPTAVICALLAQAVFQVTPAEAYTDRGIWVFPEFQAFLGSLAMVSPVHAASAYWTLPIEISFYAVIFLFLVAGRLGRLEGFFRLMVLLSAVYLHLLLASLFLFPSLGWLDFGFGLKNMLLLRHMPFFVLGYLIYRRSALGRPLSVFDTALAFFCVYLSCLEIGIRAWQLVPDYYYITRFTPVATLAISVFLLALLFIHRTASGAWRFIGEGRRAKQVRFAGLMTYPIYLLHEVIGGATLDLTSRIGLPEGMGLMVAFLAVLAFAAEVVRLEQALNARALFQQILPRHA